MAEFTLVILFLILLALVFDFYNGMNDAANSIATVVSTRALTPLQAVVFAAIGNFAALFIYGTAVAKTIGKGTVQHSALHHSIELVVFAALVGAIFWAAFATHSGIPVSISHCLIGGLVGAGFVSGGFDALVVSGITTIAIFIVISPLVGALIAVFIVGGINHLTHQRSPGSTGGFFRRLQLISSGFMSLGHGGNDAQKTVGIITFLLIGAGLHVSADPIPFWVLLISYTTIALGTLIGGWKVIRTLGMKITDLKPHQGFAAETGGAVTLAMTALGGIPVSTTHTITGAVIGVGAARRLSAVRWGVTRRILVAWVLTLPVSGFVAGATLYVVGGLGLG